MPYTLAHLPPPSSSSSSASASPIPSSGKMDVISRLSDRFGTYRGHHEVQATEYSKLFDSTVQKSKAETDLLRNQYFANSSQSSTPCNNSSTVNTSTSSTGSNTVNGTPTTTTGTKGRANKRTKKAVLNESGESQPVTKAAKKTGPKGSRGKAGAQNQVPILPAPQTGGSTTPSNQVQTPGSIPSSPLHCNGKNTPTDIKPSLSLINSGNNSSSNNTTATNGHHHNNMQSPGPIVRMPSIADIKREIMNHPHSQLTAPLPQGNSFNPQSNNNHFHQQQLPSLMMPNNNNPNNTSMNLSDDFSFENLLEGLDGLDEENPYIRDILMCPSLPSSSSSTTTLSSASFTSSNQSSGHLMNMQVGPHHQIHSQQQGQPMMQHQPQQGCNVNLNQPSNTQIMQQQRPNIVPNSNNGNPRGMRPQGMQPQVINVQQMNQTRMQGSNQGIQVNQYGMSQGMNPGVNQATQMHQMQQQQTNPVYGHPNHVPSQGQYMSQMQQSDNGMHLMDHQQPSVMSQNSYGGMSQNQQPHMQQQQFVQRAINFNSDPNQLNQNHAFNSSNNQQQPQQNMNAQQGPPMRGQMQLQRQVSQDNHHQQQPHMNVNYGQQYF